MRTAASLAVLACGMAAAPWLRLGPSAEDAPAVAAVAGLIAGSLIAGVLIDRARRRAALVCGLAVLGVALWCLAAGIVAPAGPHFLLGALGLGAGMSFLAANALVWAAAPGSRAAALCLLNLPLPVGGILNPFLTPETALLAAAALATVALAIALWAPMPPPAPAPPEVRPATSLLALVPFMYAVCEAASWHMLAAFWRVAHVLGLVTAYLIVSYGVPLGLIVGRAASARLASAIAPLTLLRFAAFAMAFATALMLLARSPSAACVAAFVVGLAMAPVLPTLLALAGGALPRRPATGMAIALAAGWLGVAASAPLISWIADRSNGHLAMLLLPLLSLGIALATVPMRYSSRPTPCPIPLAPSAIQSSQPDRPDRDSATRD